MRNLNEIPKEVWQVSLILSRKYISQENLLYCREVVLKNEQYFPMYCQYFTATPEKLEQYYKELQKLNPKVDTYKNYSEEYEDLPKKGIVQQIKELSEKNITKPTVKDIQDFFKKAQEEQDRKNELKIKENQLFKKYFG